MQYSFYVQVFSSENHEKKYFAYKKSEENS